jgi:hypothetical protein
LWLITSTGRWIRYLAWNTGNVRAGCARSPRSTGAPTRKGKMQAIAKNYSPEVKRWAARLHRRRGPGLRLWRCPWLAWTQAIQDRFARSWMPGRGNEQTLLQRTSLLMRHYQQPAPQVQVGWQTSITAGWPGHDRTLLIPLPPAPPERLILMQTLLSREHYFQSSSILRTGLLRNSMQYAGHVEG